MMVEPRGRGRGLYGVLLLIGALIGILVLGGLRFALQPPAHGVHYHANWAVVLDGERLDMTGMRYMEDVFQCSVDANLQRPEDRVHMHEANHDIVHVHDAGATWGHLLANIGFGLGDDYLQTDQGRYVEGEGGTLKFVLNGSEVRSVRNLTIGDQDRLLISFGPESVEQVIAEQFPLVESSAGEYNTRPDPASCSGAHEPTVGERLRQAFWF